VLLRHAAKERPRLGLGWVTPTPAADLTSTAKILHSDGDMLQLHAVATVDATGRAWLDKSYDMETAAGRVQSATLSRSRSLQDVFNTSANDHAPPTGRCPAATGARSGRSRACATPPT
jgi:hypothetical protein